MRCITRVILLTCLALTPAYAAEPFGAPPKPASPNCGPETRLSFKITLHSKADFVSFIKNTEAHPNLSLRLDNFKDQTTGAVDWNKVSASITTDHVQGQTIYILHYNPLSCSGYTLKMTSEGDVSNVGCCGK